MEPSEHESGARRVAFVGQSTYFTVCSLNHAVNGLEPFFVDHRSGADSTGLRRALEERDPDVVIVFRPEIVATGLFAGLRARTLGFITEPLPRPGAQVHKDLERRLRDLSAADPSNFDRIVSFDPTIAPTADQYVRVWRSVPLPVADECFADDRGWSTPPRVVFIGRSTEHRESFLVPVKHEFDVLHIAHGIHGEELARFLREEVEVGINLHNEPYATFENRVPIHLAAGNLVLSEPLSPAHGLEPNIDFVEVGSPAALEAALHHLHNYPRIYERIRLRGRRKAEAFRASRVWPRLIGDLFRDLAAFGSERTL